MIAAVLGCAGPPSSEGVPAEPDRFQVVVAADSHIIDSFYTCCESTPLDTSSLQLAEERFRITLDAVAALDPVPEALFVAGDVIHEYPSSEPAFYDTNRTAFDIVAELVAEAPLPIHLGLGNHDYDVPSTPRGVSLDLFEDKWDLQPWYSVDLHGWRFVHLDCQAGPTWDPADPLYLDDMGSFGAEQLAWLDEQLTAGSPTVLFFHNPPTLLRQQEDPDGTWPDLWAVLDAHPDVVQAVFTGHMHLWMDTRHLWPSDGYGLAATRFDHRNWWVMDLQRNGSDWTVPQVEEAVWGSFFYDREGDGLEARRSAPIAPDVFVTPDPRNDLAAVAAAWHAELTDQDLRGPTPDVLVGQGFTTVLTRLDGQRRRLLVQRLEGQTWVSLSPVH